MPWKNDICIIFYLLATARSFLEVAPIMQESGVCIQSLMHSYISHGCDIGIAKKCEFITIVDLQL